MPPRFSSVAAAASACLSFPSRALPHADIQGKTAPLATACLSMIAADFARAEILSPHETENAVRPPPRAYRYPPAARHAIFHAAFAHSALNRGL